MGVEDFFGSHSFSHYSTHTLSRVHLGGGRVALGSKWSLSAYRRHSSKVQYSTTLRESYAVPEGEQALL